MNGTTETNVSRTPTRRRSVLVDRAIFYIRSLLDLAFVGPLLIAAAAARFVPKKVEVGLGPVPIINSPYHKRALERFGHKAEIFVDGLWYYTSDYDYAPTFLFKGPLRAFVPYVLAVRAFFRYRFIYTYFDGGPLRSTAWLYLIEPHLVRLAGIKTVIMGFGADVLDLTRAPDRYLVDAMAHDYPKHRFIRRRIVRKVDLWTNWADHIIAGVDWVYYLYYWDTLCLSHFAVDTDKIKPSDERPEPANGPLRVLHAPNHRALKGTDFIIDAVRRLRAQGVEIDLKLAEGIPNAELLKEIERADLVVDQLVVGWYAMFAIEAMALSKPCICYLDPALLRLYTRAGLLEPNECPLISATPESIEETLRRFAADRLELADAGRPGRAYVERHHSLDAIGRMFDRIQRQVL